MRDGVASRSQAGAAATIVIAAAGTVLVAVISLSMLPWALCRRVVGADRSGRVAPRGIRLRTEPGPAGYGMAAHPPRRG